MRMCEWFRVALSAALLVVSAAPAGAQMYENVGTRARGMAGAFVAVADDATASWWNPAGLATGSYFNVVIEQGRLTQPEDPIGLERAQRTGTTGFAAAFPALGLSYYRFRISEMQPAGTTGAVADTRQDPTEAGGRVRSLAVSALGATVGQSIGDHLVIGSTLKVLRGGTTSTAVDGSRAPLDVGDELDVQRSTRADLDVGAMASLGPVRVGVSVRNLREPEFGRDENRLKLKRQARAGIGVFTRPFGPVQTVTFAADTDLTETDTPFGPVRHAVGGAEAWLFGRRFGVRGGLSSNVVGEKQTSTSTGVSVAPLAGVYLEAARTFGADRSLKGWSTTVRLTF